MKNVLRRRPGAAMIVAVIALVAALAGTAVAAGTIKLGALTTGAQNKTVGPGKLTYVTTTTPVPANTTTAVSATCPAGLEVIGGGIKWTTLPAPTHVVTDSHPTTSGWSGHVFSGINNSATTTAICANSRVVTGAPPTS